MKPQLPISRVTNLIPEESQRLWAVDESEGRRRLLASDIDGVLQLDGSFALVAQDGDRVVLARSLNRPMRYFLAKSTDGPALIVAERIDEIAAELARRGWADQFHPSYSRMVPAHHVTTLRLVGCPDPNPVQTRFFDPPRGTLPKDLDLIGRHYIEALYAELRRWLPSYMVLAAIWGTSFLFIKVGVRELHPLWLTFGRVAAGAAVLLVVLAVTRDRLPRDRALWGHLTVVATFGVSVPFTLFGFGEQRVSSVLAGIWNAATPLVALPLAVLVFRTERMTWRRAAGIAIGFAGVLVVLGVWRGTGGSQLTGQLMCFGAAMCYAVAIPYQKKFVAGRSGRR